jgi:voltage-gated potassium channel
MAGAVSQSFYASLAVGAIWILVAASGLMVLGYAIIASPTGIVSAELVQAARRPVSTQACLACSAEAVPHNGRFPGEAFVWQGARREQPGGL